MAHKYDILLVKDFSRFSRRNSRGLVELEDLRDAGVRIISIGDGIDFPNDDDWLKIQFQFLINEMPVTDTSKKVRNVIKRRQVDGKWICAAPYGYIVNKRKEFEDRPHRSGHRAPHLPTSTTTMAGGTRKSPISSPRRASPPPACPSRCARKPPARNTKRDGQARLGDRDRAGHPRQRLLHRHTPPGQDHPRQDQRQGRARGTKSEQIVIENHHQPIIDYRTFATTRALREKPLPLPLPRRQEVRQRLLRLPRSAVTAAARCSP